MKEKNPHEQLETLARYLGDEELMLAEKNEEYVRLNILKILAFIEGIEELNPDLATCQIEIALLDIHQTLCRLSEYAEYVKELGSLLEKDFTDTEIPAAEQILRKMLEECFTGDLSERFIIKTLR
ncbi:MAG: hypothetical protein LUF04_05405 [Bacteroides sp.]|nr:hypothetical protein [Bacteroides sp.]